jgi:hypothetical protein
MTVVGVGLICLAASSLVIKSVLPIQLEMIGLAYIPKALSSIDNEKEDIIAERESFAAFERRISTLEARSPRSDSQSVHSFEIPLDTTDRVPNNQLREVQRAYRETVMATSHYEREYGHSLAADMHEEFTEEIVIAVMTGEQLTPQLKAALQQQAVQSQNERTRLLQDVDDEQTGVEQAQQTMWPVVTACEGFDEVSLARQSFLDLRDQHEQFCAHEDHVTAVVEQRQHQHHETPQQWLNGDVGDLQGYLYADLPIQYPVLADGIALIKQVREAQRAVAAVLGRIPG